MAFIHNSTYPIVYVFISLGSTHTWDQIFVRQNDWSSPLPEKSSLHPSAFSPAKASRWCFSDFPQPSGLAHLLHSTDLPPCFPYQTMSSQGGRLRLLDYAFPGAGALCAKAGDHTHVYDDDSLGSNTMCPLPAGCLHVHDLWTTAAQLLKNLSLDLPS